MPPAQPVRHTVRAALYQRISFDLAGDEHGVQNQRAKQEELAAARGYTVVMSKSDNDMSASAGKRRPGYEAVMAAARRGEIDVIIVFQTSRFWRHRRERAEGIDILKQAGVSIIATKGPSIDMTTAAGRMMAGILGEFDTAESEIKSERQQLANEAAARAGKVRRTSPRAFGWLDDRRTPHPAEAAAVRDAYQALLAGGTVTGVRQDWERRGLRPRLAPFGPLPEKSWPRESVRAILVNPRNAGLVVYQGEILPGVRGQWEPLVDEETWRAVVHLLAPRAPRDVRRRESSGVTTLLGKLATCRCGNFVGGSVNMQGAPTYRCIQATRHGRKGPHVAVRRADVDEHIRGLVIARMSMDDAAALAAAAGKPDTGRLITEAAAIRQRLARLGSLYAAGQIAEEDLVSGRAEGTAMLKAIEAQLGEAAAENVLAPMALAESAAGYWDSLTIDLRRAVVRQLMWVTLFPAGKGRLFTPEISLPPGRGIVWRHGNPAVAGSR